jgi:hypothetical protein
MDSVFRRHDVFLVGMRKSPAVRIECRNLPPC